jgi:hypothetical protein
MLLESLPLLLPSAPDTPEPAQKRERSGDATGTADCRGVDSGSDLGSVVSAASSPPLSPLL